MKSTTIVKAWQIKRSADSFESFKKFSFLGRIIPDTNEIGETTKLLTAVKNYHQAHILKTMW